MASSSVNNFCACDEHANRKKAEYRTERKTERRNISLIEFICLLPYKITAGKLVT
jgi:hypothetical protein